MTTVNTGEKNNRYHIVVKYLFNYLICPLNWCFDSLTADQTQTKPDSSASVKGVVDGQTPETSCNSEARTLEECVAILRDPQVGSQSSRELVSFWLKV